MKSDSSLFLDNLKCCHFVVTGQFRNPKVQHFQGFAAFRGLFPLLKLSVNPCVLRSMDFEKLKQKYENKLEALAAFPVWTVEQIKEILNLDFNTIQRFVTAGWLCKFTVSRCTFYSTEKKDSKRIIHIPKTLADELREYVGGIYGLEKESRIFNVSKYGLHREIDRAVKSCGLPDICVHGLRHSCASFLQSEELKIPEVVVSAILGHSNTKSMTGRYSHAYEKDLIAVAERLNKIMEDIDNVSEES